MNIYSIYDQATGIFKDKRFSGSPDMLLDQLRVDIGCSFILGEYDHLSQRVDLQTGEVVDYIPPQPTPRHEWNPETKRWVYVPGEAEALYFAREDAMQRINMECSISLSTLRATYPDDEVTSWAKQEAEARAWLADNSAPTPLIGSLASTRGIPLDILAAKIIEKADAFAVLSGQIIGLRQAREDAINAASTAAEVRAALALLFAGSPT